eukprot:3851843-Amphidinium_carterae.1
MPRLQVVADLFADVGAAPTLVQQLSAPNQTLQLSAVSALQKLSGSPAGKRAPASATTTALFLRV